ncbi:ABC transporter substrate-binding protein [uncultured Bosea sp.]|uniref:ABC transporter substrate-binding protein n=1 Tax=uncultured Bosea sp. TaxID=211457 RepID=UPI0025FF948E|nr:ABC transporter substrate-binding protein [uncultured Bosea sp.]
MLSKHGLAQGLKKARVQLSWVSNIQYAGDWLAQENNLMAKYGVEVAWQPGGPNAPASLVTLAAGKADIAYSNWFQLLDAVNQGNDFVMIGASFPRSPHGLLSLAKKPILEPRSLVGAKVLAQAPNDKTAIDATLALAGLPNQWTWVPTGFSPEPLLAGDGDAFTAFSTNQPITLEKMGLKAGKDFHFVFFDDLGFRTFGSIIVTTQSFLKSNRAAVVGYMRGLIDGWAMNRKDPTVAAHLVVEKYGADLGLDLDQQIRQNELQIPLTQYAEPGKLPLSLDKDLIEGLMFKAARATGRSKLPDVATIADFTVVQEAYEGRQ